VLLGEGAWAVVHPTGDEVFGRMHEHATFDRSAVADERVGEL